MTYEEILIETRGRVGLLTLNQPDKLNAMSNTMNREVRKAIAAWNADDSVGTIVITGAGRGFCSGADIGRFEDVVRGDAPATSAYPSETEWVDLVRGSKPIICAINGVAVGLGITFTLPCDLRVAAEGARMSFRFVHVGLTPEMASSHYLTNLVGMGNAMELMLTGKFVLGEEAQRIGLVNHVYSADSLVDEAVKLAQEIAENPGWHLERVKRLVHENYTERDVSWVLKREREIFAQAQRSDAHREALIAFREKREPSRGRAWVKRGGAETPAASVQEIPTSAASG